MTYTLKKCTFSNKLAFLVPFWHHTVLLQISKHEQNVLYKTSISLQKLIYTPLEKHKLPYFLINIILCCVLFKHQFSARLSLNINRLWIFKWLDSLRASVYSTIDLFIVLIRFYTMQN